MYQIKHCFILLVLLLAGLPASLAALEINSVQIGFDNYYRRGCWCPVKLNVATTIKPFKGELKCLIDNSAYVLPLDIPVNQTQSVFFPVVIHSANPEIKISVFDEQTQKEIQQISGIILKEVPPDGFLIGIEKNLYHIFRTEFLRYSQAAQLSCFFAFDLAGLPSDWQVYESIDLLVLPQENILTTAQQEVLTTWQHALGGNILFYQRGSGISLAGLKQTRLLRPANPTIKPDVYQLGIPNLWRGYFRGLFGNMLVLYFVVLFIIGLCWLWWQLKKFPEKWFWTVLLGLITLTIVLVYLFIIPRRFRSYDIYRIASLDPAHQLVTERRLIGVRCHLDETENKRLLGFDLPDTDLSWSMFVKPLFYSENHYFRTPITYKKEHGSGQPYFSLYRNGRLFFEGLSTRQLTGKLSISVLDSTDNDKKYRLTNQTPVDLDFCSIIAGGSALPDRPEEAKIIYLGQFSSGMTREISIGAVKTSLNQIAEIPRFHKSFFEYWWNNYLKLQYRKTENNKLIMLGWAKNDMPEVKQTDCLGVMHHPVLWVIPLEIP